MATCKENCIHYSVCGIWDRKVFVDYEKNIMSDFSDLPNVEEHCRNYLPKQTKAEWIDAGFDGFYKCSNCGFIHCTKKQFERCRLHYLYCGHCGAEMVGRR